MGEFVRLRRPPQLHPHLQEPPGQDGDTRPLLQLRGRPAAGDAHCRPGTSAPAEAARSLIWRWYSRSSAAPREPHALQRFLGHFACEYSLRATLGRGFVLAAVKAWVRSMAHPRHGVDFPPRAVELRARSRASVTL